MGYSLTFTININQMQLDIPYMDPMATVVHHSYVMIIPKYWRLDSIYTDDFDHDGRHFLVNL